MSIKIPKTEMSHWSGTPLTEIAHVFNTWSSKTIRMFFTCETCVLSSCVSRVKLQMGFVKCEIFTCDFSISHVKISHRTFHKWNFTGEIGTCRHIAIIMLDYFRSGLSLKSGDVSWKQLYRFAILHAPSFPTIFHHGRRLLQRSVEQWNRI